LISLNYLLIRYVRNFCTDAWRSYGDFCRYTSTVQYGRSTMSADWHSA